MTLPAPTYDLVLLLDPQAEDATRAKLVADARAAIEAQGELLRHDEWGERALTYPIEKKTSARYHLLQFHVGKIELLDGLDRSLRLADEVLRFRIIKLAPGVGAPPDMSAAGAAAPAVATPSAAPSAPATEAPSAEPATAAAAAEPTEAPAEQAADEQAPAVAESPAAAEAAPAAADAEPAAAGEAEPTAEVAVGESS
jgi:small subunit ribosomal protein S6